MLAPVAMFGRLFFRKAKSQGKAMAAPKETAVARPQVLTWEERNWNLPIVGNHDDLWIFDDRRSCPCTVVDADFHLPVDGEKAAKDYRFEYDSTGNKVTIHKED